MHYINGREAREGDPVIVRHNYNGLKVRAGVIHSLIATSTSCNCRVAVPIPGGCDQFTVTLGKEVLHAEDAAAAFEWPEK